jgi:glycosyltransferase involved in cell wall biosynthesis
MNDIKVCLIAPEFLPVWGGTGSYCIELTKALADKVELHVATIDRVANNDKNEHLKQEFLRSLNKRVYLHTLTKGSAGDTFFFNAKMQLAVFQKMPALLREYRFDIIHSNFPAMPDLMARIFSKKSFKSVTTVHTCIEEHREGTKRSGEKLYTIEDSEKMTLVLLPYLLMCERFFLSKEKNLIFVSKYMKDFVSSRYGSTIKSASKWIINTGVDTQEFSPDKINGFREFFPELNGIEPVILFSGRLIALKGISVLTRAMKDVVEANKEAHFVFAGPGKQDLVLSGMKKYGIPRERYTLLGSVDRFKMPYLYAKSEMLVLPSFVESFPLCLLEAMSSGSLVIASNVGGVSEIVDNGVDGVLFNAGKPAELSRNIIHFLEDKEAGKNIRRKAREKIVERFSSTRMAEDTIRTYEEILEK